MKNLFVIAVLLSLSGYSQGINTLSLGLCDTIPNNLYQRTHLKSLIIENGQGYCHSPIKILSSEVSQLESLETLVYSYYSSVSKLPPEIKRLKNLKNLTVSDIIPEIGEIASLEVLSLTVVNKQELEGLKALRFKKLINLRQLSIRFYGNFKPSEFAGLFMDLGELKNLKQLSLMNVSEEIVAQIPQFNNLASFSISGLSGPLSFDFNKMPNITSLAINRADSLFELPESIYSLVKLTDLAITTTALTAIPDGISNLKQLKNLNLTFNKITYLATDIVDLKQLETLSLVRNFNVKSLPKDIGKLTNLKRLAVQSCQLSELPESITNLSKLEALSFPTNNIRTLPADWSKLKNLVRLDAERNKIETIPASLLKLERLEYLILGHNCLEGTIFDNKQLPIQGLKSLKVLDVAYNDLLSLPYDIGLLRNLEDLNIYNNQIMALPESIGKLRRLESLSMSNNQIEALPKSMKRLRIYEFSCHNNAFDGYGSMRKNFPKANRVWIDKDFKVSWLRARMLGREVYYR